ncbi:MAG: IPT/TIG domain-containing protein [Cyanobacteriota/Melainabacteria group bacterium]
MRSIKLLTGSILLTAALSSSSLPGFAAAEMAILQESKPLVTRAGAWHTWKDRFHLHPGQESLPLRLTFLNGADGRPKATNMTATLDGAPLAQFNDFKGADNFSIDLSGKIQNNSRLEVRGFGPSGARMRWSLYIQKPTISSVSPDSIGTNDTIKISGTNFSSDLNHLKVYLGKKRVKPLSSSPGEITAKVTGEPEGGEQDLTVAVSSVKSEPFKVSVRSHPRITRVDMLATMPREPVTISGTGFSPVAAENIVTIGNYRANVRSSTENSITFTVPDMPFPKWHVPIKVTSRGVPCRGHAYIHLDLRVVPNEGIPMR